MRSVVMTSSLDAFSINWFSCDLSGEWPLRSWHCGAIVNELFCLEQLTIKFHSKGRQKNLLCLELQICKIRRRTFGDTLFRSKMTVSNCCEGCCWMDDLIQDGLRWLLNSKFSSHSSNWRSSLNFAKKKQKILLILFKSNEISTLHDL